MKALAGLLLAATAAFAQPKTPLGPYARPGVPVVFSSDAPVTVELAGWKWRVDGVRAVPPPRVPCTVRFADDSLALRAVPDGTLLIGVVGPGQLPSAPGTLVQRIDLVAGIPWDALDLFDRIVWTGLDRPDEGQRALLLRWVRMGGDLVAPRAVLDAADVGLGRLQAVGVQDEAAAPRPHPVPRTGNVLPEIYDLAPARGEGSPPLQEARLVLAGMALVLLLGLLGGAGGWIGRRLCLGLTLAVVALAAGLGVGLTRRSFVPLAEARIEVTYYPAGTSEYARTRVYRVWRATGPGAVLGEREGVPLFYRAAGDPWWTAPGGAIAFDEGVSRALAVDREVVGCSPLPADGEDPRELRRLLRRVAPAGAKSGWRWGDRVLRPAGAALEPLLRVDVVAVR